MEIQLISGPNSSGKSLFAEGLAVSSGGPLVYAATMIPEGEENQRRVEKHRLQRKDKGFTTIEVPWDIQELSVKPETVVLLEDASNLLANGIFLHGADAGEALERISTLAQKCRKVIIVTISGLSVEDYSGETAEYIRQLNLLNELLLDAAALAFEMREGEAVPLKRQV